MLIRTLLPAMAGLALATSAAFAEAPAAPATPAAPGPMMQMRHFDQADMAKHMAEMCKNHYAVAVGKLAELEAMLELTAKQKPLFDRWRDAVLTAAKARVDECATIKLPDHDMSVVDFAKMHQKKLEAQLSILKAQMPALEALNAALTPEQQKTFKRTGLHFAMERMDGMAHRWEGMKGGMMGGMHGDGMRTMIIRRHVDGGDDMPPPPPPPAN